MNVLHGCNTVSTRASDVTSYTPQFCIRKVLKRVDASVVAGSDEIFDNASRTAGFFAISSNSYLFSLKISFIAIMLLTMVSASFFNELGVSACNAIDNSVILAHAIFISFGSVIAVGFSPCGPDMAAFRFDEAAQNSAYVGFTFPEPA